MMQEKDQEGPGSDAHPHVPRGQWLTMRRARLQGDESFARTWETRWSMVRVLVFVSSVGAVALLRHHTLWAALAAAAGMAAFAGAVLRYIMWDNRCAFAQRVLLIIEESLHAISHRDRPVRAWQRPDDPSDPAASLPVVIESGPTWPLTEQEREDLDLYAPPVGVFGLLNRTSTQLGARRLRDMVDAVCLSRGHIERRQQAVRWLEAHDEQRLGLMAALVPLRDSSTHLDSLVHHLQDVQPLPRSILSRGIRLWSFPSGIIFVHAALCIFEGQYAWISRLTMLLAINVALLLVLRRKVRCMNALVSPWVPLADTFRRLWAVVQYAETTLPEEVPLGSLKEHFHDISTRTRISSLCRWLEWADAQGMIRGLLNVVIFLDWHIAEAVLARVAPSRDVLLRGLSALAEMEALCSLACFSAEQSVTCYPRPADGTSLFIRDGCHPLFLPQDVTPNSVLLAPDKRTWVITGPNAAGKSTFLRMTGVNVLLAQMGAAVAAREMTWSPVRLITDVRIRDDLAKNESYFLAEVRRLRRLVLDSENEIPILGLIDEPFRGTNSQERVATGVALLEHLMASHHFFLIATHEDLLAQVAAQSASARNYHFQEHLHDGGITFDYQLRPGPATTRTALRILEREGYPESLLARARRLLADSPPDTVSA